MWLYLLIFAIPMLWYFFGDQKSHRSVGALAAFITFLAFFVGMSDMFGGYDRYIYGEVFDGIANITTVNGSYEQNNAFDGFASEPGYTYINIVLSWFTANRYIFILLYTLIIYTLLFVSLKRYAENYPIALIVFMGLWFYFSFTYLRQVLGATIAWLAIKYVIEKKLIKYLIVCFIVITIHKSAIIFTPVYFITRMRYKSSVIIGLLTIALALGISPIPNALFMAYGDNSSIEMQGDYSASGTLRIEYILEAVLFLYIFITQRDAITKSKQNIVLYNIGILFCATLLFFVRSENGGRLSWYFMIGTIVTITNAVTKGINRKITTMGTIVLCLALYLRIFIAWQAAAMSLYPYKTFLSNGVRDGDTTWERYEYDHQYDVDKLYRTPFRFNANFKR